MVKYPRSVPTVPTSFEGTVAAVSNPEVHARALVTNAAGLTLVDPARVLTTPCKTFGDITFKRTSVFGGQIVYTVAARNDAEPPFVLTRMDGAICLTAKGGTSAEEREKIDAVSHH